MLTVIEDQIGTGNVLTNDTDPEGNTSHSKLGNRPSEWYGSTEC